MGRRTLWAVLGVRTMLRSRLCRPWPYDLGLIGGSLGLICEMGVLTLPAGGGHGRQGHRWQQGARSPQPPGWGEACLCLPSDFWASLWPSLKPPEQGAGGAGHPVSQGEKGLPRVSPHSALPLQLCLAGEVRGPWRPLHSAFSVCLSVCLPAGCPRARRV